MDRALNTVLEVQLAAWARLGLCLLQETAVEEPPVVRGPAYEKGEPDESGSPLAEDSGTVDAVS